MLRVENLTKDFGATRAVDRLSFELPAGKVCGFVGPNGAGKTTTMRILATLDVPTSGEAWVGGVSIEEDPYRIRRMIGFMPDHLGVYPAMTVRDYLEFYARAYEIEPVARTRRIDQIIDFTGLDAIAGKMVESLSKGMRQRLNLGRALVNDPGILIMDEPAAGLDPRARVELRYLIRNLATQNKTIFISSHILTELAEMCDSMLIIDQGRLVTFGSFEDIQRSLQGTVQIHLRLAAADAVPGLERFLLERPSVSDIAPTEHAGLRFTFADPTESIPDLVREILLAGFPVVEFRPVTLTMEDVFIRITDEAQNNHHNGDSAAQSSDGHPIDKPRQTEGARS